MPETVTVDRPPAATKSATVSASALAQHLDCSRTYIGKLEAEGVLHRALDGNGFDVDASRVAYLRFLRREHRRSPRTQADADHVKAKTEMLQLRLLEKQRKLVRREDANELLDEICGVVLTHLSGMGARCSRDMVVRRNIDAVVLQVRTELAQACTRMADERGEPPLDQQD